MIGQLEPIAVTKAKANPTSRRVLPPNVLGQQRKEIDVKTKQPILVVGAISTNFFIKQINTMKKSFLFAIDTKTEEILVSASEKGSNKINFIERIQRHQNELLFEAVAALTSIAKAADFDMTNFKAKDKVCQMTYNKHIENK